MCPCRPPWTLLLCIRQSPGPLHAHAAEKHCLWQAEAEHSDACRPQTSYLLCFAACAAEKDAAEKAEAEHKERLQAERPADPPSAAPLATDETAEPSSVAEDDAAPDKETDGEGAAGERTAGM